MPAGAMMHRPLPQFDDEVVGTDELGSGESGSGEDGPGDIVVPIVIISVVLVALAACSIALSCYLWRRRRYPRSVAGGQVALLDQQGLRPEDLRSDLPPEALHAFDTPRFPPPLLSPSQTMEVAGAEQQEQQQARAAPHAKRILPQYSTPPHRLSHLTSPHLTPAVAPLQPLWRGARAASALLPGAPAGRGGASRREAGVGGRVPRGGGARGRRHVERPEGAGRQPAHDHRAGQ